MTVKQFFKSTTFKCIITLLCILLISGIFLTIMNGLLEVTEGEKLQRAVGKIYDGGEATPVIYGRDDKEITASETSPEGLIDEPVAYDNAEIIQMYKILYGSETDYLVLSKGAGGYSGGSVTCWVAVNVNPDAKSIVKVRKVSISENVNQSFIGNITDAFLTSFTEEYKDYYSTADGYLTSGASMSSNAICNSVNGATTHIKTAVFGVSSANPYDGFDYTDMINVSDPDSYFEAGENGYIIFHIVTKLDGYADAFTLDITVNSEKAVESFVIVKNGSTQGYASKMYPVSNYIGWKSENFFAALNDNKTAIDTDAITTSASSSDYLCVYAGLFATANYDNAWEAMQND